ncbi:MAG: AAA-like domain-containing protein, partial [Acidobacteriota bacterium]
MSTATPRPALQPDGGALIPGRHIYIERPEDAELLDALRAGEYCNLLTARQMGKTSLMNRVVRQLRADGVACSAFDIGALLDSEQGKSEWYRGLVERIAEDLELDLDAAAWWSSQGSGSVNQRLVRFFRDEVLGEGDRRVAIFLDEIDSTIELPFTDDLFKVIRSIYNDRGLVPDYGRIAFCLVGVASANELIKDRRSTAYNVGRTIALRDFDPQRDDLSPFYEAFDDPDEGEAVVGEILRWTGGQPFLTQRLCYELLELKGDQGSLGAEDVAAHVERQFSSHERLSHDTHFQQIDRFIDERVSDRLATLKLYERVLAGKPEVDRANRQCAQLRLSGLVKRNAEGFLQNRNPIYRRLYDAAWLKSVMPRQLVRRVAAASTIAALFLAGAFYYNLTVTEPLQLATTEQFAILRATVSEIEAQQAFEVLTGERPVPGLTLPIFGEASLRGQAEQATLDYRAFWNRRADSLETRALQRLEDGDEDRALLLGAAAMVKYGGPLHPELRAIYEERGYSRLYRTIRGSFAGWDRIDFSRNSRLVAITGADGVYEVESGKVGFPIPTADLWSVRFSQDSDLIAGGTGNGTVNIWNSNSGEQIGTILSDEKPHDLDFWGAYLAAVGLREDGGTVSIREVSSTKEVFRAKIPRRGRAVRFSPGGEQLLVGSTRDARLLEVATGEVRHVFESGAVGGVSFS